MQKCQLTYFQTDDELYHWKLSFESHDCDITIAGKESYQTSEEAIEYAEDFAKKGDFEISGIDYTEFY